MERISQRRRPERRRCRQQHSGPRPYARGQGHGVSQALPRVACRSGHSICRRYQGPPSPRTPRLRPHVLHTHLAPVEGESAFSIARALNRTRSQSHALSITAILNRTHSQARTRSILGGLLVCCIRPWFQPSSPIRVSRSPAQLLSAHRGEVGKKAQAVVKAWRRVRTPTTTQQIRTPPWRASPLLPTLLCSSAAQSHALAHGPRSRPSLTVPFRLSGLSRLLSLPPPRCSSALPRRCVRG